MNRVLLDRSGLNRGRIARSGVVHIDVPGTVVAGIPTRITVGAIGLDADVVLRLSSTADDLFLPASVAIAQPAGVATVLWMPAHAGTHTVSAAAPRGRLHGECVVEVHPDNSPHLRPIDIADIGRTYPVAVRVPGATQRARLHIVVPRAYTITISPIGDRPATPVGLVLAAAGTLIAAAPPAVYPQLTASLAAGDYNITITAAVGATPHYGILVN